MADKADAKDQSGSETAEDPLKNLKSEFSRKFENTDKKMADLLAANQALVSQLQKLTQPKKQEVATKKPSELIYDNPDEALNIVKEQAKEELRREIDARESKAQERNNAIAALYNDYPELADLNNPLTKRATEIYNGYSESDKQSAMSFKLAVREAASEVGVLPVTKRTKSDSEEYVGGGSSNGGGESKKRGKKEEEIPQSMEDFARLVGLDMDDPKQRDALKKRMQRKDWTRYQ